MKKLLFLIAFAVVLWLLPQHGDAAYVPPRLIPTAGSVQALTLTITGTNASASQTTTVQNADFVSVNFTGSTGTIAAGGSTDVQGADSYNLYTSAQLTTAKISATQVQVTASRTAPGGANAITVKYNITDLNTKEFDSVQRGTIATGSTASFTACPSGATHAMLTWLGINGFDRASYNTITANGTITATNGLGSLASWQVLCLK